MKTDSREILDSFSLKNFVVEHQLVKNLARSFRFIHGLILQQPVVTS